MSGKYPTLLREQADKLDEQRQNLLVELDALADVDPAADGETRSVADIEARAAAIGEEGKALREQADAKRAEADRLDAIAEERQKAPRGPEFIRKPDQPDAGDIRSMSAQQLTDTVVRATEAREIDATGAKAIMRRHGKDEQWLRHIAARSTDVYMSAFAKMMTGSEVTLSDHERAALAVGTNTQGGFLVPTTLDPTLILTSDGAVNVLRPLARNVTITTGNTWRGVTTAGSSAAFGAELSEVADGSPEIAQPTVPLYLAKAFVQASFEAFEDIDALASDVLMLFNDARVVLESAKHMTGTGSGQPTGIFTALDANTNVEIVSTTAATISATDLMAVKRAVPQRFRGRSTWVMNPYFADAIRALGTSLGNSFTGYLPDANADRLLNTPVVESDDAPDTVTTTVRDNQIVIGDFQNFIIADKPGSMSVEFVPLLFNTSNNLPDGRRGWLAHWRNGSDSVNDLAFRLYQDKTSA